MNALARVDTSDPDLTPAEVKALTRMLAKREQYVHDGRVRDAHGAGTMIMILWQELKRESSIDPTDFGGLHE